MQKLILIFIMLFAIVSGFFSYTYFYSKINRHFKPNKEITQAVLQQENLLPVTIIGSTVAGLSAALYITRSGIQAVVFENIATNTTDQDLNQEEFWLDKGYITKNALIDDMKHQIKKLGATFVSETLVKVDTLAWPFICTLANGQTFSTLSIIVAIDKNANQNLFSNNALFDKEGHIIMINRSQQTCIPGLFAAGTIQNSQYSQLIVAASEGAKAALDANKFLYNINVTTQIIDQLTKNHSENFIHLMQ